MKKICFLLSLNLVCTLAFSQNFNYHLLTTENSDGAKTIQGVDIDGDGDVDILGAAYHSDTLFMMLNDGDENFTYEVLISNYDGAYFIDAIDLDNDSDLDLISSSYKGGEIIWHENDGNQNFTEHVITNSFGGAFMLETVDFDNDSDIDIVAVAETANEFRVFVNDGNQNFTSLLIDTPNAPTNVRSADFDMDGDLDFVVTHSLDNSIVIYDNDGNQNFTSHIITDTLDNVRGVNIGDIDNDNDIDIVAVFKNGVGGLRWYKNEGGLNFSEISITENLPGGWDVSVNDFDLDGDLDIITASDDPGSVIYIWENDGSQNFFKYKIASFTGARYIDIVDVDSDGNLDILGTAFTGDEFAWYEHETLDEFLANNPFTEVQIKDGLLWKSMISTNLFNSNQSINILEVDYSDNSNVLGMSGIPTGFKKTSEFAEEAGAITAVNGSFFNTSTGGGVTHTVVDFEVVNPTDTSFAINRPENDEGMLVINEESQPSIILKPVSGNWEDVPTEKYMLAGGPILLTAGEINAMDQISFNYDRHPRTLVGLTQDDKILLITIDGRTSEANGMSTLELAKLLKSLNVVDAINFDGGGSTTMWAKDQSDNGIINYPSDNGIFDHLGEREVANAILVSVAPVMGTEDHNSDAFSFVSNPVLDTLSLRLLNETIADSIEIYDMQGKAIMKTEITNQQNITINVSVLAKGVYILKLIEKNPSNKNLTTAKLFIKK